MPQKGLFCRQKWCLCGAALAPLFFLSAVWFFFQMGFPGGIDLSTFQSDHKETSIWDVSNITAKKVLMDAGHNTTFTVLTFEIELKRKLAFSSYMLTMPPVFLACITLVVFWLPPERPDRTALGKNLRRMSRENRP